VFVFHDKLSETDFGHGIRLTDLGGSNSLNAFLWHTPAGTNAPAHDHPEEQFGYILKGSFEVAIGDEKQVLTAGDSYFIPGGVPHAFRMIEDSVAIDIFSPRRPVPTPQG
jgi:quercetin dioxygenase-like cupin family protein